jgi:hypothetical protein
MACELARAPVSQRFSVPLAPCKITLCSYIWRILQAAERLCSQVKPPTIIASISGAPPTMTYMTLPAVWVISLQMMYTACTDMSASVPVSGTCVVCIPVYMLCTGIAFEVLETVSLGFQEQTEHIYSHFDSLILCPHACMCRALGICILNTLTARFPFSIGHADTGAHIYMYSPLTCSTLYDTFPSRPSDTLKKTALSHSFPSLSN